MTRAEFIQTFVDGVSAGRRRNFPDITPAELAAASVDTSERALKLWRKHRAHYLFVPRERFELELGRNASGPRLVVVEGGRP